MGERFGKYILEELLGRGGMAEVYRAQLDDGTFPKTVCIKRILPELAKVSGFADMLRDEAALIARVSHANIVQALDFGEVSGTLYIAMELVDGVSLGRIMHALRQTGVAFPRSRALHIAICICRGLHAAHTATSNGKPLMLVHRDVSPQNVLLGLDGSVKVADFGIARATERITRTRTGVVKGKPGYMAPEQVMMAQACDHRVDQFATAIVLWEMLAGRPLFRGRTAMQLMKAVTACDVPSLRTIRDAVPPTLDDVVLRALARDPGERFPDMAAFEEALDGELVRLGATASDIDTRVLVRHTLEVEPLLAAAAPKKRTRTTKEDALDAMTMEAAPELFATSTEGVYARPLAPRSGKTKRNT